MYVWYSRTIDCFINITFINCFCFWVWIKGAIFCCIITFYFLNSKTNVAANINLLNSDSKSLSSFLIGDSVFASCISGLKKFKISTLYVHQWSDIDKIYLYLKDPFESKYQLLINGRGKVGIKKLKNPKAFNECSQTIDDVYENLEDYNLTMERKVLIVFDNMIADMEAIKNQRNSTKSVKLFVRYWV